MSQQFAGYLELRRRFDQCSGTLIRRKMEGLNRSHYVFRRNHEELHQALFDFQQPEVWLGLFDVERRPELHAVMDEIARLLHNFVASAKTLEDHTRKIVNDLYATKGFFEEYKMRMTTAFARDPLAKFLQDLRNYTLHRQVPILSATFGLRDNPTRFDSRIRLQLDALREWDGWTAKAREFLSTMSEPPCLSTLVGTYRAKVDELYQWLDGEQAAAFPDEFAEMKLLYDQIVAMERVPDAGSAEPRGSRE